MRNSDADELFRFVWTDNLGTPFALGGHYIVSDNVFGLKILVLSLQDVGNFRVSNHSAIIEGARMATEIYPGRGNVKELLVPLAPELVMKLNVSISLRIVDDWETYTRTVESENNTIIVNAHDEYLPVPNGYRKEEWVDKIADFILARWGTWVHAGGYPFFRVWHENGTREEWGDDGFKRLMKHVGKPDLSCHPTSNFNATLSLWAAQHLGANWFLNNDAISEFHMSDQGCPLNLKDFLDLPVAANEIYTYGQYTPGSAIWLSVNGSAIHFGLYVHMSTSRFFTAGGYELPSEMILGFISTATAIYEEFALPASRLYGVIGRSATESIWKAEKESRTIGLNEAKDLLRTALVSFSNGSYKFSASCAEQARLMADNAVSSDFTAQTVPIVGVSLMLGGSVIAGFYWRKKRKKTCLNA